MITLLATDGAHGLTHRRIDKHLQLPQGSTSAYFPKRFDLFVLGFAKLIDMDMADTAQCFAPAIAKIGSLKPLTISLVADCQYRLWQSMRVPSNRHRMLARFEFFLQAARDPVLLEQQELKRRQLSAFTELMFKALGAKNPDRATAEFGNLGRGDMMTHFLVPASVAGRQITPASYQTAIQRIIEETDRTPSDPF